MDLSLVIPLLNEEESLPELTEWIVRVASAEKYDFEIIYIDDGSTDNSWEVIESLADNPRQSICKKLSGQERYRLRYGRYRIIYSIQDEELTIWIVKVGHRKKIYS